MRLENKFKTKNVLQISNFKNFNFEHFWSLFCQLMELNQVRTSRHWYQVVVNGFLELNSEKNRKSNAGLGFMNWIQNKGPLFWMQFIKPSVATAAPGMGLRGMPLYQVRVFVPPHYKWMVSVIYFVLRMHQFQK